ncbi:MAG: protein translocase subunit SecD [Deltaproteobacteria bacterium]|nr:MAG: protein translocase subunit SecD [Deltaproteobacteria bacterium]
MPGTWWTRFVTIIVVVLWGAWMLIPTFTGETAAERHARTAEQASEASEGAPRSTADGDDSEEPQPWYAALLPEKRINLGIDLQGGIDMTLQVEVDEAIISHVQRDIGPVRDAAEREGVKLAEVRRAPGEATLLIRGAEGVELDTIRVFMEKHFPGYAYTNSRTLPTADGEEARFHAFTVTEEQRKYIAEQSVQQALETLRNRIDETGVKEPSIVLKGGHRINVQLPGIEDIQQAVKAIGTTAVLEFHLVDEEVMKNFSDVERALVTAEKELPPEVYNDDQALSDWMVQHGHIPADDRLMWKYESTPEGDVRSDPIVVKQEIMLTGDDINDARVGLNQYNEPYVSLEFKPRGANIFAEVTAENVGRRFAIVLDKRVRSAPVIREKIGGGRASIEMGVTDYQLAMEEAKVLSLVLRTGALPAPVTIGDIRQVGASLGEDAIAAGEEATLVGFGLVLLFMVIYYRQLGVVSVMALLANVELVLALLAAAGATLTLPGIAGIALTVGMAVDCNIIIYERIREERRLGKNDRTAADTGFSKGVWAVIDANITTFIAGVVLYTYGTGPIKGFAVTLMIGIITTLFTGIFMSRTLVDFLTRKATSRLSF